MDNAEIGLERGAVVLMRYHPQWHKNFEAEAARLRPVVGGRPIEHVGSTAVEGLDAKPIIDIAIAVDSLTEAEQLIEPLAALGYEHKGEAGTSGRRFFVKGPEEKRTVYLHFGLPNGEFGSLVTFRDILRSRPELVKEYTRIKHALAMEFATNRKAYTSGKVGFIQKVLVGTNIESMQTPTISLKSATIADKPVLSELLYNYQRELLSYSGHAEEEIKTYKYLSDYFTDSQRAAYFIIANTEIAGFVLVNTHTLIEPQAHSIAEFYVVPAHRENKVGERAAALAFAKFPGKWEVAQMEANQPAVKFWRKVIANFTGGQYKETLLDSDAWRGPVQVFDVA